MQILLSCLKFWDSKLLIKAYFGNYNGGTTSINGNGAENLVQVTNSQLEQIREEKRKISTKKNKKKDELIPRESEFNKKYDVEIDSETDDEYYIEEELSH